MTRTWDRRLAVSVVVVALSWLGALPAAAQNVSMTLDPTLLYATNVSTATVTLATAAPAGGRKLYVGYYQNNGELLFPADITIPEGQTGTTFTVTARDVPNYYGTQRTIQVDLYSDAARTQHVRGKNITYRPRLVVAVISFTPRIVFSGGPAAPGLIMLNTYAPPGGLVVTLSNTVPDHLAVPATVTVPEGQQQVGLQVVAKKSVGREATIKATPGLAETTVTVRANRVKTYTLSKTSVVHGESVTGTVTFEYPAPAGGTNFWIDFGAMSSAQAGADVIPFSYTVPEGQTSATFTVKTYEQQNTRNVPVYVRHTGVADEGLGRQLEILNNPVTAITLDPPTVEENGTTTGKVTVTRPAGAAGNRVVVHPGNSNDATVPNEVVVPAGQTSVTFPITAKTITGDTREAIILAHTYNTTLQTPLTIRKRTAKVSTVTLNPARVVGAQTAAGTVTLDSPAPAAGLKVTLASSDVNIATVGSSITIAAGQTTGTFQATGKVIPAERFADISATGGAVTKTGRLTVAAPPAPSGPVTGLGTPATPVAIATITVDPASVRAGARARGQISLTAAAPSGGVQVGLTSSDVASGRVPAQVMVRAGDTSATFDLTMAPGLVAGKTVTVTATAGSTTKAVTVTVPR